MRKSIMAGVIACFALAGGSYLALHADLRNTSPKGGQVEGSLEIYGNADAKAVAPLISVFESRHPFLKIRYRDLESTALYRRFVAETDGGRASADLVWSSAMDLQAKLINDGYAQSYSSPEEPALPPTAIWKDMGYSVTAEPVALVYNKRLIARDEVPRTHRALEQLLTVRRTALTGKVTTYDPSRSNIGYLYLTQDFAITRDTRSLLQAIAASRPQLSATTAPMIDAVANERAAIAYNVVGSYALERAHADPRLGVVFPRDYTIIASRVAFIARGARHPAAAKLFLDFLLSRRGQKLLSRGWLPPVRNDTPGLPLGPEQARPIRGGPQLFVNLDPVKRQRFLADWNAILTEEADKP